MSVLSECLSKTVNCIARLTPRAVSPAKSTSPVKFNVPVRTMSSRKECVEDNFPKCSEKNLEKSGCMEKKKKKEKEGKKDSPFKSMWYNPECCIDPCPDILPRFDELYWKPSDKAKRKYSQTWNECPEIKIVPKKICCFEKVKFPPFKKRPKAQRPDTACPPPDPECPKGDKKCQKIRMPGCREARQPPKCKTERGPSNCVKVCTPYPSFSECQRPKRKPRRPVECECLALLNMCDVYAMLRKKMAQKK